jgi:cytochrome c oxidase subunit 2
MISADVNHSFYVPAFRIKQDVIAGSTHYLVFTPEKVGSYNVACAEYCGLQHSAMYTKIVVMPEEDYMNWYNTKSKEVNQQATIMNK